MQRALLWLNLYGCEAVRRKLKNRQKVHFFVFRLFLSLHRTTSRPYRLSHTKALRIDQSYTSKDQSQKFSRKNIENWRSPENDILFRFWFLVIGLFKKKILFCFFNAKTKGSIYFCTMDGCFRILKKVLSELICTRLYIPCIWIFIYIPYFRE